MRGDHISHNESPNDHQEHFNEVSGYEMEKRCQNILYENGDSCIFNNERIPKRNNPNEVYTMLDTITNGKYAEIKSVTSYSIDYRNQLKAKNIQISRFKHETMPDLGITEVPDTIILYFHKEYLWNEQLLRNGYKRLIHVLNEEHRTLYIKNVIVVLGETRNVITYHF